MIKHKLTFKSILLALTVLTIATILVACEPPIEEEKVKVIAPTYKPGNLRQVFSRMESVRLNWDNVSSRKEFIIKRSDTIDGIYEEVGRSESNYFTDRHLVKSTIYYYRISYINSDNKESDESDPFPAVTAIPAVVGFDIPSFDADNLKVSLAWQVNADANGYEILREANEDGNYEVITTPPLAAGVIEYIDDTIRPNIPYKYRIRAYKVLPSGVKSYSEESSIKRVTVNRAIPQGIEVLIVNDKTISFKWQEVFAPTLDLRGYYIYRAEEFPDIDTSYKIVGNKTSLSDVSFIDINRDAGKEYYYKVGTYDVSNKQNISEYISIITMPPPVDGINVDPLFIKDKEFEIKWSPAPVTANKISGYSIMYRTVPFLTTDSVDKHKTTYVKLQSDPGATSQIASGAGLTADTEYYVYVRPYILLPLTEGGEDTDGIPGNEPAAEPTDALFSKVTTKPALPQHIEGEVKIRTKMSPRSPTVDAKNASSITLKWNFEDDGAEKYEYHIYRSTHSGSGFDEGTKQAIIYKNYATGELELTPAGIAVADNQSAVITGSLNKKIEYTNSGLELGQTYYYKLRVKRLANASPLVVENVSVFPVDPLITATQLQIVTGLAQDIAATDYTQITLTWDKDPGVPHYIVYRTKSSGGALEELNAVVAPADLGNGGKYTFKDTTAEYGVAYDYYVKASTADTFNKGPKSSTITNKTTKLLDCPAGLTSSTVSDTQINLSWPAVTGAEYYTVTRKTTASPAEVNITVAGDPKIAGTTVSATGLSAGTKYTFSVYAHIGTTIKSVAKTVNGYTCPGIPSNLVAHRNITDLDTYKLSWTKSSAEATMTVHYKLFRMLDDGVKDPTDPANYVEAGSGITNNTQQPDPNANLEPFKKYHYMLKAYIPLAVTGTVDLYSTGYSTPATGNLDTGLGTPEGFSVKVISNAPIRVELKWSIVSGASGYKVYRGSTLISDNVGNSNISFIDETAPGTYTYKVFAYSGSNNGAEAVKSNFNAN